MDDYNIRDYSKSGGFVRKDELRAEGRRRVTIETVEVIDAFPDKDKPPAKELALVFTDGTKFGLSSRINQETIADLFGERSSGWIGKVVELYLDPTVRNPSGAKVGGIRIARPDAQDADEDTFLSDLEETLLPPPPAKGNGAEKPRGRAASRRTGGER